MPTVLITFDDRRALLAALKPGMYFTRPTSPVGSFYIPGVNLEFQIPSEPTPTKESE